MSGSVYGRYFQVSTWGESHGKGLGVVIDGCPAGIPLSERDIQQYLDRRKPGQTAYSTPRKEDDAVEILSGIFEGRTTGTPISLIVYNKQQRSSDYSEIASYYRPGHADYTFDSKYGFRDYRGGGRSSGRETIGRVAAGAVAMKVLEYLKINVTAYVYAIGNIQISEENFDLSYRDQNPCSMPDKEAAKKAAAYLDECKKQGDSSGGIVKCLVTGMPAGIGDPVFEKISANLAKAMFSIGAVKSFELGDGLLAARSKGSIHNDAFTMDEHHHIKKETNHSGGTLGGMTDGSDILMTIGFKPTPSIFSTQQTVNKSGELIDINIKGRHDPIIVPRAVVVVESMAALTLVDALFANMHSTIDGINDFYREK